MKELTREQALSRAAALCGKSEHSTGEIARKLQQWGVPPGDAEKIIDYLIDEKYIDNQRFARAFCLDKMRYNQWGRIKIRQALRMLRLSDREIASGLEEIDEEEYAAILRRVLAQKSRSLRDEDDYTRRNKLIRHALSRGFETDLVIDTVEQLA